MPHSTPPTIKTLMTKLSLCISMLLCDLEKPSLVKHSHMMNMAQSPPSTTHPLSLVSLQASPSPPVSSQNSPEPAPSSDPQAFSRSPPWRSHPAPFKYFDRHLLSTSRETAEKNLRFTFGFKYILLHPLQMLLKHFGNGYLKVS